MVSENGRGIRFPEDLVGDPVQDRIWTVRWPRTRADTRGRVIALAGLTAYRKGTGELCGFVYPQIVSLQDIFSMYINKK